MPTSHQQPPAAAATGRRRAAGRLWLLLAAATAAVCIASTLARAAARRAPAGPLSHAGGIPHSIASRSESDSAVRRRLAWIMPRLAAARAQSARPELKAAVLGGAVVATLTGALTLLTLYGLPHQQATRVLTAVWLALTGRTIWHLKAVMQATVNTAVGFLADAIPPTELMHRTAAMADDLPRQLEEAVTETAHLSLANKTKFLRYNRAQTVFVLSLLAAAACAATSAGGW